MKYDRIGTFQTPSRGNGRDAAIRPNKTDRFRAGFLLFSPVLAHLLMIRNEARNSRFGAFWEMGKTVANEAKRP